MGKIMVREKSGKSQGILFLAKNRGKVRELFYFRSKVRIFFSRMAQCRDFYKLLKYRKSIGPTGVP